MGADSGIQWTHATFNPWRGCSKVAPGCKFCYAESNYSVRMHGVRWGTEKQGGTRVRLADAGWRPPLAWNRAAEKAGERRRVFCASLADVFENWEGDILDHKGRLLFLCTKCGHHEHIVGDCTKCGATSGARLSTMTDLRRDLFALIDKTPWLDWLLLTKRPENIRDMWADRSLEDAAEQWGKPGGHDAGLYRPNVWLGCSVSDQATLADLEKLAACRDLTPVLFASGEPLLGSMKFGCTCFLCDNTKPGGGVCRNCGKAAAWRGLNWVILGGESGPNARPCNLKWIRSAVAQCKQADVPCFVKQLGSQPFHCDERHDGGAARYGDSVSCRGEVCLDQPFVTHPKGGDISEWPNDICVREFPQVTVPS